VPASVQVSFAQHGPPFFPQGWHVEVRLLVPLDVQARS
jgi:hypothetical protein